MSANDVDLNYGFRVKTDTFLDDLELMNRAVYGIGKRGWVDFTGYVHRKRRDAERINRSASMYTMPYLKR